MTFETQHAVRNCQLVEDLDDGLEDTSGVSVRDLLALGEFGVRILSVALFCGDASKVPKRLSFGSSK